MNIDPGVWLRRAAERLRRPARLPPWPHLRWTLHAWLRRIGPLGSIGVALASVALAVDLLVLAPAQEAAVRLRAQADQRQAEAQGRGQEDPAAQLAHFYAFFPSAQTLPDALEVLYGAAESHGVMLERADYRAADAHTEALWRYDVALPIRGSYLQIRRFLATALAKVPHAALTDVRFEKQKRDDAVVDARLGFSLYFRRTP